MRYTRWVWGYKDVVYIFFKFNGTSSKLFFLFFDLKYLFFIWWDFVFNMRQIHSLMKIIFKIFYLWKLRYSYCYVMLDERRLGLQKQIWFNIFYVFNGFGFKAFFNKGFVLLDSGNIHIKQTYRENLGHSVCENYYYFF